MNITKERIFAALVEAGAISASAAIPGGFHWSGGAPVEQLKFRHADPVKYAAYLANDINVILDLEEPKPEENHDDDAV
jgi:hypothetical protein